MGWGKKIVKAGLAVVTSEECKKQGKNIIGQLLTKIGNKLAESNDNESLRADINELQLSMCELVEHYDTELARLQKKSRRNSILISVLGGVGIVAAIVLAIVL